ncbi:hypothetical protein M8818_007732 [Zalaria obscura]|uniref:Uncharacterized protein n=1 Tax=Zalaria obscura TaxID=2024903 RepID=A0ACC3S3Z1_9PEZI
MAHVYNRYSNGLEEWLPPNKTNPNPGLNYPPWDAPEARPFPPDLVYRAPGLGWVEQDRYQPHRLGHGFRPKHYWVRPSDGKRTGTMGRLKDALTGEGPDVFVASVGDPRLSWDLGPSKADWSNWKGPIYDETWNHRFETARMTGTPFYENREAPWARGKRRENQRYDFFERKYKHWSKPLWSDVQWRRNAGRNSEPVALRDSYGRWSPASSHPPPFKLIPPWEGRTNHIQLPTPEQLRRQEEIESFIDSVRAGLSMFS